MQRLGIVLVAWLTCSSLAGQASANGRYPRAMRLIQNPIDQEHLVVAGTFGLAVSRNGGESWNYVCESAFSDPNTILDPLIGFANDGTLYTGTDLDLRRSDPAICQFDVVLGQAPDELVPDYTFDADGESLVGIVSTIVDGKDEATIQLSADGETWEPLGVPIEDRVVLTLDVAPSDAERLYISALAPEVDDEGQAVGQRGVLLVSSDRGESWQEHDIPGSSFDAQPFIARIHPSDPDLVYVRLNGQKLDEFDLPEADDALLVSYDGGESWQELIRRPSKILAFALSPDGATVLAGFGQPDDSTVSADRDQHGLYRIVHQESSDAVEIEHRLPGISTHCLTWTSEGLFVCLRQFDTNFEVGFTTDDAFTDYETVTPLLQLNRLNPPRECPEDAEAAVCPTRWETDCMRLLSCATTPATGGANGAGGASPAEGGEGGNESDGIGGTAGVGGAPPLETTGGAPAKSGDASGCACRFRGASRASSLDGHVGLLGLALFWGAWQRRRRRSAARASRARPTNRRSA